MRKMIGLIAIGIGLVVCSADAQEASRRAMAKELLNLMNVQASIDAIFAEVKQIMPAQMAKTTGQTNVSSNASCQTDRMIDMMSESISWDKIKDEYIAIYAETFTEDEMKGIIAFYKSPAGQAFIKKNPELEKRVTKLQTKLMMQSIQMLQGLTKEQKKTAPTSTVPENAK